MLGLVVLAWLVVGLTWGALHWWIVPRIDTFRPWLEARATQAIGLQVRVARLASKTNSFIPSFELEQVALFDNQGRAVLQLPKVQVAVSVRSLWRLGFEQMVIDAPQLEVRRFKDGRITVAGMDVAGTSTLNAPLQDWFFSQIEFAIQGGSVRWTDETRNTDAIELTHVNLWVRNSGRRHDLRLEATPPALWGDRVSVGGQFMQPLLTRQNGRWQEWEGQLYTAFERVDLSALRRHVDLKMDVRQGRGALRAWVDVSQGQLTGATTDVALEEVDLTLNQDLPPLALQHIYGRVAGRELANGFEVSAHNLTFDAADGLHWPGGNVHVMYLGGEGAIAPRGEFQADRLDLATLAQLLQRLPIPDLWRDQLFQYAPQGNANKLALTWQGTLSALQSYTAQGQLSQLTVAAVKGQPGVSGLNANFELNQLGGKADVQLEQGTVDLPSVLQQSQVDVSRFAAQLRWQVKGDQLAVQANDVRFANPDGEGTAQVKWHTSDAALAPNHSRFPGVLDLQATLNHVDGTKVHRYLPLLLDVRARDYVRDAITAGQANNVRFAVKGDIQTMPHPDLRQGQFKISADIQHGALTFVPRSLQPADESPWPTLADVSGQLLIDRTQLQVKNANAVVAQAPDVHISSADVTIPDLLHTTVNLNAALKGGVSDALKVINASPLKDLTSAALAQAQGSGAAQASLQLSLPIAHLNQSKVRGSVLFSGNDLQITPDTPKFSRVRGQLNFSQSGLDLKGVQARALGGDVLLDGGLVFSPLATALRAPTQIVATGSVSAEGLQQAKELGWVTQLARRAVGTASYTASLGFRQGRPELLIQSDLQGMALNLPAPLKKSAPSLLPLRIQTELTAAPRAGGAAAPRLSDRLSLSLAGVGRAVYERDLSGAFARVTSGVVSLGANAQETWPMPTQGVFAQLNLPFLDVDAWQAVFADLAATYGDHTEAMAYLPSTLAVQADVLQVAGRSFNQLVAAGSREGAVWRANLHANELNGYVEHRPTQGADADSSAGRVYARLQHLSIAPSAATQVEAMLDAQPASVPALDIVVDDFELRGKHMGRLEVQALNRMANATPASPGVPEWRLNQFNLRTPEATLTASGNWARLQPTSAPQKTSNPSERRRTVLNFKLDVADGGALLARLGMKDVVRQASGKLEGQVAWLGSPLKLDYPTLGGAFTVNMAAGQFLKADPGIAKLLGVLSLQALPRRLTLDFRDVFSEGFRFDFLRGDVTVVQGIAHTNNLQMKGVNAAVLMEGQADIDRETQDMKVVVVPEINAGTASLLASVINPAVGLGSFLAQLFLRRPLIESNTQELHVTGSWTDPQVTKVNHARPSTDSKP